MRDFGWGFACSKCGDSGSGGPGTKPRTCGCSAAEARGVALALGTIGAAVAWGEMALWFDEGRIGHARSGRTNLASGEAAILRACGVLP